MSGSPPPQTDLSLRARHRTGSLLALCAVLLAACSTVPAPAPTAATAPATDIEAAAPLPQQQYLAVESPQETQEMVVFALGLLGTGYRFGGSNPEAGLDCSGMVGYIVAQVSGLRLPHNAALIAEQTRPVERAALQPGDLVFFNTTHRPHSHMGIYLGEGRFIHAPSSRGHVRISRLDNPYFAPRFDGARTLLATE